MENKAVNVANKIMYHISRENNWNIGDVFLPNRVYIKFNETDNVHSLDSDSCFLYSKKSR